MASPEVVPIEMPKQSVVISGPHTGGTTDLALVSHVDAVLPIITVTPNTTVIDYSGNGHHGELSGPYEQGIPGLVSGDLALHINGYPGNVTVPSMLDVSQDWTMSGWINTYPDSQFGQHISSVVYAGTATAGFNQAGTFNVVYAPTQAPGFSFWVSKHDVFNDEDYIIVLPTPGTVETQVPLGAHMWAVTFTTDTSTVYAFDSFSRGVIVDGNYPLLAGSQTETGTLGPLTWSAAYSTVPPSSVPINLRIIGTGHNGSAFLSGGALRAAGTIPLGISNLNLSAHLNTAYLGGVESGIAFRYTDIDNFWFAASQGGELHLVKRVGGVETQVGSVTLTDQQLFEGPILVSVDLSGSSITATAHYTNTNPQFHHDTRTISVSDGFNSGATRHGVLLGNDVWPGGFGNSGSVDMFRAASSFPTGNASFYVDGSLLYTEDLGYVVLAPNSQFGGHFNFFTDPYMEPLTEFHIGPMISGIIAAGDYDENAFWSRALSAGEIAGMYGASGSMASYSSAVLGLGPDSYYHLNEVPIVDITPGIPQESRVRMISPSLLTELAVWDEPTYDLGDLRFIGEPLIVMARHEHDPPSDEFNQSIYEYGWLRFETADLVTPVFEPFTYPPPESYGLDDSKGEFDMDMQANTTTGYVNPDFVYLPDAIPPISFGGTLAFPPTGGDGTYVGGPDGIAPGYPWCLAADGVHAYGWGNRLREITTGVVGEDLYYGATVFDYNAISSFAYGYVIATDRVTGRIVTLTYRDDPILNYGYFIDEIEPNTATLVNSVQMWDDVTQTGFGGTTAAGFVQPYNFLLTAVGGIVFLTASTPPQFDTGYAPNDVVWKITMATGAGADQWAFRTGDNLPIVGMEMGGTPRGPTVPAIAKTPKVVVLKQPSIAIPKQNTATS